MIEYNKIIKKIFPKTLLQKADYSLNNILAVSRELNYPYNNLISIHIAGTNGKGSVSTKIAKALSLSGFKTALFTSPHISTFRERIAINDELISCKDVIFYYKKIKNAEKKTKVKLSFFETIASMAFLYFFDEKVDFAVIEAGLGGKYDATNIITPILSIITSIGFDHVNILGDTLNKIAFQKAGIIKNNIPVVVGPSAYLEPIIKTAQEKNSRIIQVPEQKGFYDLQNSLIAKKGLEDLQKKYKISNQIIEASLKKRPRCRFEEHQNLGPKIVIFDVAHNADGLNNLKNTLKEKFPDKKIRVVLGLSKKKDENKNCKIIASFSSFVHIVEAKVLKAMPSQNVKNTFLNINYLDTAIEKSITAGVKKAKDLAEKNNEVLLISGSFYIMSEARKALGIEELRDDAQLNEKV